MQAQWEDRIRQFLEGSAEPLSRGQSQSLETRHNARFSRVMNPSKFVRRREVLSLPFWKDVKPSGSSAAISTRQPGSLGDQPLSRLETSGFSFTLA
jgi:hypothetical protein